MTSETARPRRSRSLALLSAAVLTTAACASFVEVPVETPLQSKLDVTTFRRVLIAGFATDLGEQDVDLSQETSRLLQNQLRSNSKLQVLEPDHPPLHDALERALETLGEGGKYGKAEKEQFKVETDRIRSEERRVGKECRL